MSETIRSFIAVVVLPEAAARLREAQERLGRVEPGVKWVSPDGLHITLRFLGGVEQGRLEAVWRSVRAGLEGREAFLMRFRGVGAFPGRSRPRVVWAGVEAGAEEMAALAELVEAACERHGFARESRPFRAHLTLGRAREAMPNSALAEAMDELADAELGEMVVTRVSLMRSELTRRGAIYHELDHVPLRGGGEQR